MSLELKVLIGWAFGTYKTTPLLHAYGIEKRENQ
jgi:hypothetical protein